LLYSVPTVPINDDMK